MKEIGFQLNRRTYSFDELKSGEIPNRLTPFERTTLEFCHDWLNGCKTFALQTSGSTGKPKKMIAERGQLETSARNTAQALHLKEGDTALLCLDTRYIAGKMMLVRSFLTGMNLIATEPSSNPLEELSQEIKIDFAAFVPYQLQSILNSESTRVKLDNFGVVIVGGAELDAKTIAGLQDFKAQFYATYGMTETLSHVALQKLNPPNPQEYFQVIPGGIVIQQDDRGCLSIQANYLGDHPVVTNDLVEILSPDRFRWLGRWDNIINSGAVKVIPERIEHEIGKIFEAVGISNRFLIAGLADSKLGNKVVLIVEGIISSELQVLLFEKMIPRLTQFEVPREIRFLPKFIETPSQKIDRIRTVESLRAFTPPPLSGA